ncbi:MAG: hypothetical protein BWY43_00650 [candidate division WS2 bacterium ADurb.Bin280]|uniref:Translocation protein TolB n=1 Tax=candidate division WS2 bacterium ADurb.Bin280 TaxID=1852829 RepID=A0A1V5SCX6_9BACT|nr:MAG: hypothetical protein BWY43_00650 [candidate division WS2 bacterium ADurb.Bin280]
MSKKTKIILAGVAVLLILATLAYIYFFSKDKNEDKTIQNYSVAEEYEELGLNQNQATDFNNSGQATRYNPNNGAIERYDEDSGEYQRIATIDKEASYTEISPDAKKVLYTTTNNPESRFSENVYLFDIDNADREYEIKDVFSPHFLPDGSLIYQSFSNNSSELKIVKDATTKTIPLPDDTEKIIEAIDSRSVIVFDFQTDLAEATAWIIDIPNQKTTQITQGEGLKVKAVIDSSCIGIQKSKGDKTSVELYNHETGKTVATIEGISLDDIDWRDDRVFYYFEKGVVYKSLFASNQAKEKIQVVEGPILQLKVLGNQKIFALSLDKLDIIDLR